VNDGNQRPPGYGQPPWSASAQGPTQPGAQQQLGYGPPQPPGYGAAAPQYGQPPGYSPYAPPAVATAQGPSAYGDSAGEHLRMTRGRYRATAYVFFAFLMQVAIVTGLFALVSSVACAATGVNDDVTAMVTLACGGSGFVLGAALAYFVFRDRWKCIEAFSSRFCSGLMNLSLLYVPWVALVYANVRGVQKLSGK
jgi:hypothetical protein